MTKDSINSSKGTVSNGKSKVPRWMFTREGDFTRCFLAEFIGTAILVIFTCGTCVSAGGVLTTAISFGFTITCLVVTIGHVSGCHVNPAVTAGMMACGKISLIKGTLYIIAQLLGGIAGAGALYGVLREPKNLCATTLKVDPIQGIFIEGFICFLLVFVICNACESNTKNAPLLIGIAITAGHVFAIPLTGSSMNTARSFGPAVISSIWEDHYVYWIGPIVGGILGALTHKFLFLNKDLNIVKHESASGDEENETSPV